MYRTVLNKPRENRRRLLKLFTAVFAFWLIKSNIILIIEILEPTITFYDKHIVQKKCLQILGWMKCLDISCRIMCIRDACKITIRGKKVKGTAGRLNKISKNIQRQNNISKIIWRRYVKERNQQWKRYFFSLFFVYMIAVFCLDDG